MKCLKYIDSVILETIWRICASIQTAYSNVQKHTDLTSKSRDNVHRQIAYNVQGGATHIQAAYTPESRDT